MTRTEKELRKLTIAQLREMMHVPSKLKKKDEIVAFILREASITADTTAEVKRSKNIATVDSMFSSITSPVGNVDCPLCNGEGKVWCELGLAKCPLCFPAASTAPSTRTPPLIKIEKISTSSSAVIVDELSGEISFQMNSVDSEVLTSLVTVYGFGICESIDVLGEVDNDMEKAVDRILEKTRNSAENYDLSQAQMNSEEVRDRTRVEIAEQQKKGRDDVYEDLSVLASIDSDFSRNYIFTSDSNEEDGLLKWIGMGENSVLVYDYVSIKRDAIKWYKDPAKIFFDRQESEFLVARLDGYSEWFRMQIDRVREAMYSIPETAGGIPVLFRVTEGLSVDDDEVEVVETHETEQDHVILIED